MNTIPSRRTFLGRLLAGGALFAFGSSLGRGQPSQVAQTGANPRKLGIALMGLGGYSKGELAPALQKTANCRLAGVITGDADKGRDWSRKYDFPEAAVYSYDTIQQIADNKDIDIIYVVTPPGRHKDHVLAAAKTGKHIICEKPMANSVEECDAMIAACRKANVKLSIGYRLQFEPHHQEIDRIARTKQFGPLTKMSGAHGMRLRKRVWRLDKALAGGGPLMDVGIYVIQAAVRAAGGVSPVAVTAREEPKTDPRLFNDVEEAIRFTLEFPGGATCEGFTTYSDRENRFRAEGRSGWIELDPAYSYRGISGKTSGGPMKHPEVAQQTLQMDDFADCIMTGRDTPVPGEMGRQHMQIIEAIYEAARTGKKVPVNGSRTPAAG